MALYSEVVFRLMGDKGLLVEFGDEISREINDKVRRMFQALRNEPIEGINEIIPTYRSIVIIYNPTVISLEKLKNDIKKIEKGIHCILLPESRLVSIPVLYGNSYGPDLEFVAKYHNLSIDEVIYLHCSKTYFIYMIGFLPGFPYMGELPEELVTPRLKTPRLSVPKGSVGIAQRQTGIYPMESPGGWQIIGRTPIELFDPKRDPPSFLKMGDLVQFYPISEKEYLDLVEKKT